MLTAATKKSLVACRTAGKSALLLILMLGATNCARATSDAVLRHSYFRDETGQRTFADVRDMVFTPYPKVLNEGYSRTGAFWLKIHVRGGDPATPPYVLRVQPAWLNDIRLFDPADGDSTARVTGSIHPAAVSELPFLNHAFLLRKTPEARDVYLRIQSVTAYFVDVQVLEKQTAEKAERTLEWLQLAYIISAAITCVWAAMRFLQRRDRLLGLFAISQLALVSYATLLCGFARVMLDGLVAAPRVDAMIQTVLPLAVLTGVVFYRTLLAEYTLRRVSAVALNLIVGLATLPLLFQALGQLVLARAVNQLVLLGFAGAALLTAWFGVAPIGKRRQGQFPLGVMRLVFTPLSTFVALGATSLLGVRTADAFPPHHTFMLTHAVMSTTVVAALLSYRDRKRAEQQFETLVLARQTAVQEQRAREEQAQFMSMLNHELKTPLSVLKLMVAKHPQREQAEGAIDDMAALIERSLLADRVAHDCTLERRDFSPCDILMHAVQKTPHPGRFTLDDVDAHTVNSDPELYAVIVNNLLDNALKYAPRGTPIVVKLRQESQAGRSLSCLLVRNRVGRAGVPDRARVFDKYYRAESAKAVSGTGLGLYLVKSFADALGGEVDCLIDADSICFHLCLPR